MRVTPQGGWPSRLQRRPMRVWPQTFFFSIGHNIGVSRVTQKGLTLFLWGWFGWFSCNQWRVRSATQKTLTDFFDSLKGAEEDDHRWFSHCNAIQWNFCKIIKNCTGPKISHYQTVNNFNYDCIIGVSKVTQNGLTLFFWSWSGWFSCNQLKAQLLKKLSLNALCHLIEGAEEIMIDFPFTGLENGISIWGWHKNLVIGNTWANAGIPQVLSDGTGGGGVSTR